MPRLSVRELDELRAASQRLAACHQAIALAKYANAPALLQLIYEANLPLDRILQRCDAVIQRYLVKQGVIEAPETAPAIEAGAEPEQTDQSESNQETR